MTEKLYENKKAKIPQSQHPTLHPTPHTLIKPPNPTPHTPHPTPHTPNPTPYTPHPTPDTPKMNQEKPSGSNNDRSLQEVVWAIENSGGQFSLILAKCNYTSLRSPLVRELRASYSGEIREICLQPSERKIYSKIRQELGEESPETLMVFGLESVKDIDHLLTAMNSVREEFRKHCRFPMILWATDAIARKLIRLAPDFETWMTHAEFAIAPADLADLVREKAALFFSYAADLEKSDRLDAASLQDLEAAQKELLQDEAEIEPELEANLYALLGFAKESDRQLDAAIANYESSLALWQEIGNLEYSAKILSHLTECCYRKIKAGKDSQSDRLLLQDYLQQCLQALAEADRPDLAVDYLGKFGKILRYLEDWQQLETLCSQAIERHQAENQTLELARDYSLLAEVALARQNWPEAKQLAEKSLGAIDRMFERTSPDDGETIGSDRSPQTSRDFQEKNEPIRRTGVPPVQYLETGSDRRDACPTGSDREIFIWKYPRYLASNASPLLSTLYTRSLFVLAGAQKGLAEVKGAIANLEAAKEIGNPDEDLDLYLQIIRRLYDLYFEDKKYLEAYQLKQERRSLEQQYGRRAFVGAGYLRGSKIGGKSAIAPEIAASGRDRDIEELLKRLSQPAYKIIVLYGFSGVGKSSLLNAGLIPAIQQKIFGFQEGLPVAMRVYTQWLQELGKQLTLALERKNIPIVAPLDSQEAILEQLRQSEKRNLLVVLIFDQFEEFFFTKKTKKGRNPLFEFLGECRSIFGVKVIFSLKRTYIHQLLGRPAMEDINNNILDKNIIYKVSNFTLADAESIIDRLTQKANFKLEPELTQALVRDLAGQYEKVRPIEMQVVGAQLQKENITTLRAYRESGSKPALVQRYLEEVVTDCGSENQQLAELTLFLLTDEKDRRPLKRQAELAKDLEALGAAVERLDLVLQILVESGLLFQLPESSGDRYQLAHDYLAELIRRQRQPRIQELIAQVERERQERRKLGRSLGEVRQELKDAIGEKERIEAEIRAAKVKLAEAKIGARLERSGINALRQFRAKAQLEALLAAVKAGKELQEIVKDGRPLEEYPATSPIYALQQILQEIKEKNRFQRHSNSVTSISFSPDGHYIATASHDGTARIWDTQGNLIQGLTNHRGLVNSIIFSPDGESIATSSEDGTARIWNLEGKLLRELIGHSDSVLDVSFSPDGESIATASRDSTARIWNLEGKLLRELTGHTRPVNSIIFSSDGKLIATASEDRTAGLWDIQGNLLQELIGHSDWVNSVCFSPDGKYIATASRDGTARLWDTKGNLLQELTGHSDWVNSVCFSPDGNYIATASADGTVRLWDTRGNLLQELTGHSYLATSVSFSPDGKYIATASSDRTARLWQWQENPIQELTGHSDPVTSVSFSPDGNYIATASFDCTARVWDTKGNLLQEFTGHSDSVRSVSFSPDGNYIATASGDCTARVWDRKGNLLLELTGHSDLVWSVSFSPDGKYIATASFDRTARLWDRKGNLLLELTGHSRPTTSVSFSPDGKYIATASLDCTVRIWDRKGNMFLELTDHSDPVTSVNFSPDGNYIATASGDCTARVWDTQGNLLQEFTGHSDLVWSVSFSPDGNCIATASFDRTARLWDRKGNLLQEFTGHKGSVTDVSFSPDGKYIATASRDGTARLWPVESLDELLLRGCNWLRDYLQTNPNVSEEDRHFCDDIALRAS
ncbi:MAG: hypothetical protein F6J93_30910 [Oscillatoria sp. SIO1A7]|nr:hypothetical protein [Oscillatoria sp. SIO1A7]